MISDGYIQTEFVPDLLINVV